MEERYIASIDLGSSKFGLCVARVCGDDVQIVYYKETPSDGIRSSMIANPMKASLPLKNAIREAEEELMIKILQVVVGMPRSEVEQITASARIDRGQGDEYISEEEVASLKAIALETYPLPNPDSQVMYGAVAQSFSVDSQICLMESDVVGTLSDTLEGNFKVFIGSRRATTALDKIFNSMEIAVAKKYFLPDVVAKTVLSRDEMQSGVALVDIGAGRAASRWWISVPASPRPPSTTTASCATTRPSPSAGAPSPRTSVRNCPSQKTCREDQEALRRLPAEQTGLPQRKGPADPPDRTV